MLSFTPSLSALWWALTTSAQVLSEKKNCTCGFYNGQTNDFFTDSIIVYFNETSSLPKDFIAEDYAQKYEKDWNAIYRQGADSSNIRLNNSESLQLFVQPPNNEHLVKGGGIRTTRRDIQHGSFRTLIKSPGQTTSGSSMSMMWKYNETEVAELSVMNRNNHSDAWVGTFVNNEFTTRDLGVNFTQLLEQPAANRNYTTLGGGLGNGSVSPWDYIEYRIDWTPDYINFYIGGNLTRQVLHVKNKGMPSVPSALFFKHWSTGNSFSMEGPPDRESVANIGWIRMFFNSVSTSEPVREDFAARCGFSDACSMDDVTLRGSTPFTEEATKKWKQDPYKSIKRMPALWISVACIAFSTLLLTHTFIRRVTQSKSNGHGSPTKSSAVDEVDRNALAVREHEANNHSGSLQNSSLASRPPSSKYEFTDDLAIEKLGPSQCSSVLGGSTPKTGPSPHNSVRFDSRGTTPHILSPRTSNLNTTKEDLAAFKFPGKDSESTLISPQTPHTSNDKIQMETVTESALPAPRMRSQPPPPRQRIDHLAGLTALCSVLVTVMHFGLTFVPAMVIPGAPQHNRSEYWAQKIIAPFLLNQMWLGVFFTTSVRFLTAPYLRKGKVEDIARAAVRRTPRLMIPVASIALLEYFLIDVGTTTYLRYIPSLTWSTWPYVTRYANPGQYVSEVLELIFLIPNAVPNITLHYCTGVLWTIAVQLQGTWLVLLGAMVVYEIKSPWKRMGFYFFCFVNHWYAQSWGSYLWLGLLLTDLDVTFKWKTYLSTRPAAYYPLMVFCWICVGAGFAANLIPNWVPGNFNFAISERNIHPDVATGEALLNTDRAGYPAYYTPRLNGLLFAGGMQAIVELSSTVQWLLSTRPFLLLFPHIFTIYLLHGLVFWTWGSWLLVFLAARDFSYGINVAIVGVTSYVLLFLSLPIVTPVLEALGKDVTALVWMTAQEKSPPRRRTLFPFPADVFTGRPVNLKDGAQVDVEGGAGDRSSAPTTLQSGDASSKDKSGAKVESHEL
ncbi:glycoside hydrolase family 16 protein [Cucurbitaria berberidis CBS 394.84]|uniref:Glycoside hydrolase family 16 protein n=1 Tax=Cucurbitaria berberidis CBS 394.84 TaxID=1168544 RepID=A0A9P4GH33_9PLEO|nr:glycoside hydrolase family 16 protein [Cucurbitaria berberidis CBS 394.84]KAF1846003.1 glycoside hydrolase family 16 protein [Cucurbitaria berberidis CBS 394.84]